MRTWSLSHLSLWGKVITLIDYNNTIKQKMHVYVTATNSVYLQHSDGQRCISHRTEILVDFFVDRSGHTCTCLMGKPCNRGAWVWGNGGGGMTGERGNLKVAWSTGQRWKGIVTMQDGQLIDVQKFITQMKCVGG